MIRAYFTAITTLMNTLVDHSVPVQLFAIYDGFQLRFPWFADGDIACHSGTLGELESYGFPWDEGDVSCDTLEGYISKLVALWTEVTA